jgi:pimeloyl-ACP methyl ester carboxylesterase
MSPGPGTIEASTLAVPVAGGELRLTRFGSGPRAVLGIHGITANAWSLRAVARRLGPGFTLVAPDLRGRGGSQHLPGPHGMRAHAADCAAVIQALGAQPIAVLGESMGAYLGVVLAARHPLLVRRLVLADGGLPLPPPPGFTPGMDPAPLVEAVLGPALARLSRVFPSRRAYLDFWRDHPSFAEDWNRDVEAYLDHDLEACEGGFRSRVSEAAVRADAAEQLTDPDLFTQALQSIACPITLVTAPRNLMNQPMPLLSAAIVAEWRSRLPNLSVEMVPDVNHYALMMGGRGAAVLAARLAVV